MAGLIFQNCYTSPADKTKMKDSTTPHNLRRAFFWCLPLYLMLPLSLMGCAPPVMSDASKPSTQPQVNPLNEVKPSAQPSPSSTGTVTTSGKPPMPQPNAQLAQFLPITAKAEIAGRTIQLEVARTFAEQAKGLMYRVALPDDRGMLFPFDPPRQTAFWMKNVPVDLDMVFLYQGEVKAIAHSAPPCAAEPCPIYPTEGAFVDQVIELRSGLAKELAIKVGDRIVVTTITP
jgi:uncharacterized protein